MKYLISVILIVLGTIGFIEVRYIYNSQRAVDERNLPHIKVYIETIKLQDRQIKLQENIIKTQTELIKAYKAKIKKGQ